MVQFQDSSNHSMNIKWKALFTVNLLLGILLWVGFCTDYRLKNLAADISFIWVVEIIGLITWLLVAASSLPSSWKRSFSYFLVPSAVGSVPYLLLTILIVPIRSALGAPILVDRIESPDHSKALEVYYSPDIDCGHSYQISLRYHALPILRRDILNLLYIPNDVPLCSYENGTRKGLIDTGIDWVNNDQIIVPYGNEGMKVINVGFVRFNWHSTQLRLLFGYISLLMIIYGVQRLREKQNESA